MSWLVLLAAIHTGLLVPGQESLSPLARLRALDYSLGDTGTFASLREEFVDEVLGRPPAAGAPTSEPARETVSSEIAPEASAPRPEVGRPPRTIAEHSFDNDDFEDARGIDRIPFTARTDARGAGRQPGEQGSCAPLDLGGGTVWYRYRPKANIALIANTFGSDPPAALSVFTGDALGDLTRVDCDYSEAGDAQVVFSGSNEARYFFQVTGPSGGGHVQFSLDPLGTTKLVSVSSDGRGNDNCDSGPNAASVSADGRYVAFHSCADNLVDPDTNKSADVFVRDMRTERTVRVSVTSDGGQADLNYGGSSYPAISGDGRYVAFASGAPNLVPNDGNGAVDIFVHDRDYDDDGRFDEHHPGATHTERVSISSGGAEGYRSDTWRTACVYDRSPTHDLLNQGDGCWFSDHFLSIGVSISSDGRYVAFTSELHGLVPGIGDCTDAGGLDLHGNGVDHPFLPSVVVQGADTGLLSCRQVYVRDRTERTTTLISASAGGEPANADSSSPFIARGGRWIAFASGGSNIAPVMAADGTQLPDANGQRDAFVRDLRTGTVRLVSLSSNEEQGNGSSGGIGVRGHLTISDNGRWVVFISTASNLGGEGPADRDVDVFLRDLRKGRTTLISAGPGSSGHSSISANGRYVGLTLPRDQEPDSADTENLLRPAGGSELGALQVPQDLMVYDRVTETVTSLSVATWGEDANGVSSSEPEISADGHFVVFWSDATNLDDRDTEAGFDLYIHELPWTR